MMITPGRLPLPLLFIVPSILLGSIGLGAQEGGLRFEAYESHIPHFSDAFSANLSSCLVVTYGQGLRR